MKNIQTWDLFEGSKADPVGFLDSIKSIVDDYEKKHPAAKFKKKVNAIMPYLVVARLAKSEKKIKDIMDSPVVAPNGYDGDVYITIERNNGTFDMVQVSADGNEVTVDVDIDKKGPDHNEPYTIEEFKALMNATHIGSKARNSKQ